MFKFEKLRVYQEALLFVNDVYTLSRDLPRDELFGLTSQIRRASVSIVLNIAEGSGRTKNEFNHFLDLSRGSCFECAALLYILLSMSYISKSQYEKYYDVCDKLSSMISKLKCSLRLTLNAKR